MIKLIVIILSVLFSALNPNAAFADTNSFVSVVNPVRGADFWDLKDQKVVDAVSGQMEILKNFNILATYLIRYDALEDEEVVGILKDSGDEKGLFLEVTPTWTKNTDVKYQLSASWHYAGSAFLSGYEIWERKKLIDEAFEKFKQIFGSYPKSVGAWWIDAYSLSYMEQKYGITASLVVADQYTTDNYQIWGQYFSTPYYPSKNNALHPANSLENKLSIVMMQWAPRDPINGYGDGVEQSTFSVQVNDYIDYHNLDTAYFSSLVDIYTRGQFNKFGHLVVGLENSYDWNKYSNEYQKQIKVLAEKRDTGKISIVPMRDFASWYQRTFPKLSPEHLILANDPLGTEKKVIWFMNPYYRAGWFINQDGSVFRDIRQYIEGEEEICFQKRCDKVNFATFATRVLDEVTYGHKWVIDEGKISDFKVIRVGEKIVINYLNEAGNSRTIEFLPRDISVDGKISSIDEAILDALKHDIADQKKKSEFRQSLFDWSVSSVFSKIIRFLIFLIIACLIPGLVLVGSLFERNTPVLKRVFLAMVTGFTFLTIIFYIASLLNLRFLIYIYIFVSFFLFIKLKLLSSIKFNHPSLDKLSLLSLLIIIAGTIFQILPTFKNGLVFPFGMGFWGPNTHDGVWHIALINQLTKAVPPENPIFAGSILKNYHYLYDLLIAATVFLTKISVIDLIFRFYPIIFSLLLGIGTYFLGYHLFKDRVGIIKTKVAIIFSLYFVYFAGSFGWIVEYIKQKHFGGESAFWANQSISFNLNPPFAASLLIVIAFLHLLLNNKKFKNQNGILIAVLLAGSLVGFKAYGAVLILGALLFISLINILKKDFAYFLILIFSSMLTSFIFFSNFQPDQQLIVFSPFWLIHSMIDSPDRVGWVRLSLARAAGIETNNWIKFISAEAISLLIFIVGNLGIRILSLVSLVKIKNIVKDENLLFILVFSMLSFLIPILFIQSGNPWNTIQFSYYGLYTAAVISGLVLSSLIFSLPKSFAILILSGVVILAPINSITTASFYTGYLPHGRVDSKELEALEFLSKKEDGIVLTYPYDKKLKTKIAEPWSLIVYDSTAYVSALSNKAVYLEDEPQNQILLTDYKKRLVASRDFFLRPWARFLIENGIKYIYLPKVVNIRVSEDLLPVKKIFENDEALIYMVKQ